MYHETEIIGNLGKDPEMRYTPEGKAVTVFSVAASNRKDETTWFRITTWEKLAETCNQYLHKGSKVFVKGRLQADPATGSPRVFERKDGTLGASYELTADTVRFLSGKDEASEEIPY